MDRDQAAQLRKPFPPEVVGQLPKGGVMLDYVGHAAVTDRLLEVDPEWTWEPAGVSEHGLPVFDGDNGLWIKLTVCGVTRYGYGDGKSPKECISDAIRNAAMRAGVGLDMWAKEGLESSSAARSNEPTSPRPRGSGAGESPAAAEATPSEGGPDAVTGEEAAEGPPSEDTRILVNNFLELCSSQGLKPMATFVQATGSSVKWRDLQAFNVPIEDIEKAIAYVAGKALAREG